MTTKTGWNNTNNTNNNTNMPERWNQTPPVKWGNYQNVANRLSNQGYNVNTPTLDLSMDKAYQLLLNAEAGRVQLPVKSKNNIRDELEYANRIANTSLDEYSYIVDNFFYIFDKVCTFREIETKLEQDAKKQFKILKQKGQHGKKAKYNAYKKLMIHKNETAAEKGGLLDDLNSLSAELAEFLGSEQKNKTFNKMFDKSEILKQFLQQNPKCKKVIKKSKTKTTFDKLHEYLEKSSNRDNVEINYKRKR